MHIRELIVEVRDKNLVRLGQITPDQLDLLLEDQYNNVGSWTLRLPSNHELAPALRTPGAGIIVSTSDGDVLLSGPTIKPEAAATADEPEGTLTVEGLTDTIILADRICFPQPSNVNPETQTFSHDLRFGAAETVMHAYVNANIGPGAPSARRQAHLQMGADGARGPFVAKRARFNVLGNLLSELAVTAGLGFRVIQVDDHLEFQTYQTRDRRSLVRLDIRNNQLAGERVAIAPPGATHVIVAGQGDLVNRQFTLVTTADSIAAADEWGRRIERFVDQRQTDDPDEHVQAGLEVLAKEGFSQLSVQAVPMEDFVSEFGHDWFLGDLVGVVVEGVELSSLVSGYVLTANSEGLRMGAIIGDPTTQSSRLTKMEVRVSSLERNTEIVTNVGGRLSTLESAVDGIEAALDDFATAPVGTTQIADGAVTNVKLATDAVTNAKIANNAVDTAEIVDGAVTAIKLATDSVTNAKMANNSVDTAELVAESVTSDKLAASAYPNVGHYDTYENGHALNLNPTSASYVNVTHTSGTVQTSITKRRSDTRLLIEAGGQWWSETNTSNLQFAVRIGSTDYPIAFSGGPTGVRVCWSGQRRIPSLSAGSITVTLRVAKHSGSGTPHLDSVDFAFITVTEVIP